MNNQEQSEHRACVMLILKVISRCKTWDQLQVLAKHHGHIPEIRYALNERACEITG